MRVERNIATDIIKGWASLQNSVAGKKRETTTNQLGFGPTPCFREKQKTEGINQPIKTQTKRHHTESQYIKKKIVYKQKLASVKNLLRESRN